MVKYFGKKHVILLVKALEGSNLTYINVKSLSNISIEMTCISRFYDNCIILNYIMKKRNVIYNHQVLFFFMYDEFQNFIEKFEHRFIFNTFDNIIVGYLYVS